jgi:hypothetical protein
MSEEGLSNEAIQFWYGRKVKPTFRCEPELLSLCLKFDELFPECTPAEGNRASWYAGLRKVLREFGEQEGPRFIEFAHKELERRPPLDIVDAHSIWFLHVKFKKDRKAHDPHRYLKGKYAELYDEEGER